MSSISLCMIAKNEESLIAQAINSVRSIISEIILVDTGSTDKTVSIAKELGAQVYYMPWNDDFSAPRNLSLGYASGEWILVLDADEAIARCDLPKLVALTRDKSLCIEFLQRHYTDDHRLSEFKPVSAEYPEWERNYAGYFESNLVRMFPNHCGIHYRGKVHELVEHSIAEMGKHKIVRTSVRIQHYGHTAEIRATKNKAVLYTPLGKAKTEEAPNDWKNFFELGVEHNNNGRLEESRNALQKAAQLNPGYLATWINLGYVLCEMCDYKAAIKALKIALKINPRSDEAYCNLGVCFLRMQQFSDSEKCFRAAITINPTYINAYCNLGLCLASDKRFSEAVAIFQRVLEISPTCQKAHSELGALYLASGLTEKAEAHLRKALQLGSEDSRLLLHLGQVLKIQQKNIEAADFLQRFVKLEQGRYGGKVPVQVQAFLQKVSIQCDALTTAAMLGSGISMTSSTSVQPQLEKHGNKQYNSPKGTQRGKRRKKRRH